jgi:hypothetical protein
LLSLEFIKNFKNYTDEDILEQFYYNYQIMYAVGIRQLSDLHLAPRTLSISSGKGFTITPSLTTARKT